MIVVSDTSPIANLILIDRLDLLEQIFQQVLIPPYVNSEIEALQSFEVDLHNFRKSSWIKVKAPSDQGKVRSLMTELDPGESEAIALAEEYEVDFLLINERAGTNKAIEKGLTTIGLVGVLMKAKELNLIKLLEPIFLQLKDEAGFWLGRKLMELVLKEVGER